MASAVQRRQRQVYPEKKRDFPLPHDLAPVCEATLELPNPGAIRSKGVERIASLPVAIRPTRQKLGTGAIYRLANHRDISLNKPMEEFSTTSLAMYDTESSFRL